MLIQFSVENFLSIKDKVVLSLLASKDNEHPEHLNKLAFAFGNVLWQQKFKHFFFFFQKLKRLRETTNKIGNRLVIAS